MLWVQSLAGEVKSITWVIHHPEQAILRLANQNICLWLGHRLWLGRRHVVAALLKQTDQQADDGHLALDPVREIRIPFKKVQFILEKLDWTA